MIAVISLLAALLFPVFSKAREKGRQAACQSNLRQLCLATFQYAQDNDDLFPFGGDPSDVEIDSWSGTPYADQAHQLTLLPSVLAPYIRSPQLWHCPSDSGFDEIGSFEDFPLDGRPTSFAKYGMSYGYHTELTFTGQTVGGVTTYDRDAPHAQHGPSEILLFGDLAGAWHGGTAYPDRRYEIAYCDGHVRFITRSQDDDLWHQTCTPPSGP